MGLPPERVTYTPLLHLSLGQAWLDRIEALSDGVQYEPWGLFFGRLERYKGVDHLLSAAAMQLPDASMELEVPMPWRPPTDTIAPGEEMSTT